MKAERNSWEFFFFFFFRRLDADACDVLDHARAELIRRSRTVANSPASGLVRGIAARTPCISQNAAV